MEDMKQISSVEKNTSTIIANLIALGGLYLMSYDAKWQLILGVFLFVWANNIIIRYNVLNYIQSNQENI